MITHKLFQVTLVFVPSIIAGCLAIAPLLSPYLIYIVGCLELWLIRDQSIRALIFGLSGFLPSLYVDGKIYEEVGSLRSPYFTGLAVVGKFSNSSSKSDTRKVYGMLENINRWWISFWNRRRSIRSAVSMLNSRASSIWSNQFAQ